MFLHVSSYTNSLSYFLDMHSVGHGTWHVCVISWELEEASYPIHPLSKPKPQWNPESYFFYSTGRYLQCFYIYLASHANEKFGNVPKELFINELYNAERHLALAFNRKKKNPLFKFHLFIYVCQAINHCSHLHVIKRELTYSYLQTRIYYLQLP